MSKDYHSNASRITSKKYKDNFDKIFKKDDDRRNKRKSDRKG